MAIPTPTIPSSISAVSAVELKPTQNNKAFYCYSGDIDVTTSETTMISINNIGKRDVFIAFDMGSKEKDAVDVNCFIKSNGVVIMRHAIENQDQMYGFNEIRLILPANTSLEFVLQMTSGNADWTVAAYGTYLERPN